MKDFEISLVFFSVSLESIRSQPNVSAALSTSDLIQIKKHHVICKFPDKSNICSAQAYRDHQPVSPDNPPVSG